MCLSLEDIFGGLFSKLFVGMRSSAEDLFGGLFYEHVVDMCLFQDLRDLDG